MSAVKLDDDTWTYFVVEPDCSDEEFRAKAFEIRHGRPMNNNERVLNELAGGYR